MTGFIETKTAAQPLQKIKSRRRARDSKTDNRKRRKCRQSEFSQNRCRAEHRLNGKQRDVRCEGVMIFNFLIQNKINCKLTQINEDKF